MLTLARESRALTQTELVQRLRGGISQAKLSKVENGLIAPTQSDVRALASALRYREQFFAHAHTRRAEPPTYHRKRQKLPRSKWQRIYATAEIYCVSLAVLLRSVELAPRLPSPPSIDPDEYDRRIEEIALAVRQLWLLPRGPVEDVTSLLETAGVIVIGFDFNTELCDGFSQHSSDNLPPIIFVNTRQPKDRLRFSLLHELAHLVMHHLPNPMMESEANRFAAEFLMPTSDILKDFHNLSLDKFLHLKMHWKASIHAIVYKAHTAGRLTESAYRYYLVQMAKRGWRTKEPVELVSPQERPRALQQVLRAHLGPLKYSLNDLSIVLGLDLDEIGDLYGITERPRLRLVVK
jgi:Zn-dependent peptidase ImmA (M78 family)/transcriptional regulator with XRE-family HTH domain